MCLKAVRCLPSFAVVRAHHAAPGADHLRLCFLLSPLQWFTPTTLEETPPWMRWSPSDLPGAQVPTAHAALACMAEVLAACNACDALQWVAVPSSTHNMTLAADLATPIRRAAPQALSMRHAPDVTAGEALG